MQGFEDVTLKWKDEEFVVPASDQLMLIAKIENAIAVATGMPAIAFLTSDEASKGYSALSMAYGAALRHAGADVSDQGVYLSIQEAMASGDGDVAIVVQSAVLGLLAIVSPPITRKISGVNATGKKLKRKPRKKAS